MRQRLDLYGEYLDIEWRSIKLPRLTNEVPVRVLHQGLQHKSCANDRL